MQLVAHQPYRTDATGNIVRVKVSMKPRYGRGGRRHRKVRRSKGRPS